MVLITEKIASAIRAAYSISHFVGPGEMRYVVNIRLKFLLNIIEARGALPLVGLEMQSGFSFSFNLAVPQVALEK